MKTSLFRLLFLGLLSLVLGHAAHAQTYAIMSYETARRDIQGEQPFTFSYPITVTAFSDLNKPLSLPLVVQSLARPAGATVEQALSFISLSSPTVTSTADGQAVAVTISINVPPGQSVGSYAYLVKVNPAYWPAGLLVFDDGSAINMEVRERQVQVLPPTVLITTPADGATLTYTPASGPLQVPFTFVAASADSTPVLSVDADLNGVAIPVTAGGLNSTSATGSGTLSITAGGLYTLRARASNNAATGSDSIEFNVVVNAPAPTVTPTAPANGASYSFTLGQTLSVNYGFTANSAFGGITNLSATLNGTPITLGSVTGLNTGSASASGTLGITSAGTYTLVYTGTNAVGSATATVTFTVTGVTPPPVVTITSPAVGTVVNRFTGDAPNAVPFTFGATTPFGTIQSLTVTLNGNAVTSNNGGLLTPTATGAGNFSVSAPGTYTMVVTASNGGAVATASRSFTVVESTPPSSYALTWLPPITLGAGIEGGSTMPIKFSLANATTGAAITDQNVVIAVYEVFANGTSGPATYYPYGTSGPAAPDYAISGGVYQLDYVTASGERTYKVEVYASSASSARLLGTKQFFTFAPPVTEACCGAEILVNHMPSVNGTVNGSIRVLSAESITLNGSAVITGSLLVPGTPSVRQNGKPNFGGIIEGNGAPSPTSHQITLNGGSTLGSLIRKTNPIAMPTVPAPAAPTGTQSVVVNSATQVIPAWSTVRNLVLNGNVGFKTVAPGSYGNFISNGNNSGFILGVAGATTPSVYEFQNLTLNGQTEVRIVGPVIIRVQNGFASNGSLGASSRPDWLLLQVYSGGFTLNSGNAFYGCVIAPNGTVTINGNTQFRGGITSDRLTVNGGANVISVRSTP